MAGINEVVGCFVDTNVLIAGADSRSGASRAVLLMAEIGLYQLVVSRQVLDEAERNIRKKIPRALPNFAEQLAYLNLEIHADPSWEEAANWTSIIEPKDAPILPRIIGMRGWRVSLDEARYVVSGNHVAC